MKICPGPTGPASDCFRLKVLVPIYNDDYDDDDNNNKGWENGESDNIPSDDIVNIGQEAVVASDCLRLPLCEP